MRFNTSILAAAALVLASAADLSHAAARTVAESPSSRSFVQTVNSTALPHITVRIDPSLPFIGRGDGLAMDGTAIYERFLFGEVREGRLVRAAIVHFEKFVEKKEGRAFDYPRFRMAKVGGGEYLHQIWPMPKNEVLDGEDLRALLSARGLKAGNAWLVGRYARAVDPAKQHEILIFYMESEEAVGSSIEALIPLWTKPLGMGIAGPEAQKLEREFIERQQATVRIAP